MALNLITGYAGIPHITSENDGAVNAALYGSERYVLNTGQKFAYEIISNNLIRIKDGYAMNQGRKIGLAISEYEDLTIDNGLQGVKRSDIIVIRYTKNLDTGIESADFVVVKGTSGDAYKDPALETGNIIQGDSVDDLPLYRVKIDGLSIATVEPMFNVLMSMQEMQEELTELNSNLGKIFYTTPISKYDDSVTLNATNTWQGITSIGARTYANKVHIMKLEAINATNSTVTISLGIGQDGDTLPEIIFGSAYVDPWKSISLSTLIHNPYDRDYVFFIKSGGKTVSYMKMEYLSFNMTSR